MSDDKKPKSAAQAEAEGSETIDIEWEGHTYQVPASLDDLDIRAMEALERGQGTIAVKAIFDPVTWAAIERRHRAAHAGSFTRRDSNALAGVVAEAWGLPTVGESPASSD